MIIKEIFLKAFAKVYFPDDFASYFNHTDKEVNNLIKSRIMANPIILITSFFGLPMQDFTRNKPSWNDLVKKLVGWQDEERGEYILLNSIILPFILLFNLVGVVFVTPLNLVKLATEFFPTFASSLFSHAPQLINNISPQVKVLFKIITSSLSMLFAAWNFFGRAITSPVKAGWSTWTEGQLIGGDKWGGTILGSILALLSILTTLTVYAFLFPLVMQPLSSFIVSKIPIGFIKSMSAIGTFMMPVFGKLLAGVGLMMYPQAAVGFAVLSACLLTTIGPIINYYWPKKFNLEKVDFSYMFEIEVADPGSFLSDDSDSEIYEDLAELLDTKPLKEKDSKHFMQKTNNTYIVYIGAEKKYSMELDLDFDSDSDLFTSYSESDSEVELKAYHKPPRENFKYNSSKKNSVFFNLESVEALSNPKEANTYPLIDFFGNCH